MNIAHIQNLRQKLERRANRVMAANYDTFLYVLRHFWDFLSSQPVFRELLDDLERRCPSTEKMVHLTVLGNPSLGDTEADHIEMCYYELRLSLRDRNLDQHIEKSLGHRYDRDARGHAEALESFKKVFFVPFAEYLDEQLEDQRVILFLLRRYKHRCEWFQRRELFVPCNLDLQLGEKELSKLLYRYLHDQGLDFSIEPASASGRADLVSAQTGDDPLIADVKVFNPKKGQGKSYIVKGFNQIYTYTLDYNQPFGYLIIFKTCEEDLKLPLPHQEQSTPFLVHNNKTVFFVTIDIAPHKKTASKRGKLKTIEITEDDLVGKVGKSKPKRKSKKRGTP